MGNKLYNLMNWPEIEGIVYAESDEPNELLGGRLLKEGFLIQVFRPDAVEIKVNVATMKKTYLMEKVDESGYFAVLIPSKKKLTYTLSIENVKGVVSTISDPYVFSVTLKATDVKKFISGTCENAYQFMGSHETQINGVDGVSYAVWAPNARRVSVVGSFNNYDGRLHPMIKDKDSGIFTLFIPNNVKEDKYCYEVRLRDGSTVKKADPYNMADNNDLYEFIWSENNWQHHSDVTSPMAICKINIEDIAAGVDAEKIEQLGFNYVEIDKITSTIDAKNALYAGNFCINQEVGSDELRSFINDCHSRGIGVIAECNCAYMEQGYGSFEYYDGTHLYDVREACIDSVSNGKAAIYDYNKPEVISYLLSSVMYMIKEFHVDGVKLKDVSVMLYRDYGCEAGQWTPNIYGSNENLEAIEFIKNLSNKIKKLNEKVLFIAEENSLWSKVTAGVSEEGLGFDYKINLNFQKDFASFYCKDPLFRKGDYKNLFLSMLYHYTENYILMFDAKVLNLRAAAPVLSIEEQSQSQDMVQKHMMTALTFLYTHPGKKCIDISQCNGCEEDIVQLNNIYKNNKALYELDQEAQGFQWVDTTSSEETIVAYTRFDNSGKQILAVINFTPVERIAFRLGISKPGKYSNILDKKEALWTTNEPYNGQENSLLVDLKPLEAALYDYVEFSESEKKRIKIISETNIALSKAFDDIKEKERAFEEAKVLAETAAKAEKVAVKIAKQTAKECVNAEKSLKAAKELYDKIKKESDIKLSKLTEKSVE